VRAARCVAGPAGRCDGRPALLDLALFLQPDQVAVVNLDVVVDRLAHLRRVEERVLGEKLVGRFQAAVAAEPCAHHVQGRLRRTNSTPKRTTSSEPAEVNALAQSAKSLRGDLVPRPVQLLTASGHALLVHEVDAVIDRTLAPRRVVAPAVAD